MCNVKLLFTVILLTLSITACGGSGSNDVPDVPTTPDVPIIPPLTPQVTLTASTDQILVGKTYTLSWILKDVSSCTLSGAITQTVTTNGSATITPTQQGLQKTIIDCGSVSSSVNVNVLQLTPQVTLTTSTEQAIVGNSYTISWVLKDLSSCSLSGAITQTVTESGSAQITPTQQGEQKTTIKCGEVSSSVSVNVLPEFVAIPDPVFADALSRIGHPIHNGKMSTLDALNITMLCITSKQGSYGVADSNNTAIFTNTSVPDSGVRCAYTNEYITDATGLESFLNLRTIRLEHQQIEQVNLLTLKNLYLLSLWGDPIKEINLANNTQLAFLGLSETSLTTVDTSRLMDLEEAALQQDGDRQLLPYTLSNGTLVTGFSNVDFSQNQKIKRVYLHNNPLIDLGISKNKDSLREIWANGTNVESLDLSGYKYLNYIILNDSKNLNYLNLYGVNYDSVPYRLYLNNEPSLTEIIVKNRDAYIKARDEQKIYIDSSINIVEGK